MIRHRMIATNGVELHVVEAGPDDGPVVVLAHGFPELSYSWRHQVPALAAAGYRVLAPDQRGYGRSTRPDAITDYDMPHLTDDLLGLLDDVGAEEAVFVGHDWGSMVVWHQALLHPERVTGVVGMSVPFTPRSDAPPMQILRQVMGDNFFYMLYFQEPGVADRDLGRDPATTIRRMLCGATVRADEAERAEATARMFAPGPEGFVDRIAEPDGLPGWLSEDELDHYVGEFARTGFTGGINWYRNMDRNWELTAHLAGAKVEVPSLFIGGADDPVLMMIPPGTGDDQLTDHRGNVIIEASGHWVQQEKPAEVNAALLDFLGQLHGPALEGERLMRTVALRSGQIVVRDVPEPEPGFGQVLVQVQACGICGSDLHFVKHGARMLALGQEMRGTPSLGDEPPSLDLSRDVFMGHEFSAEVLEVGKDTESFAPGTLVTSIPVLLSMTGLDPIVYSNSTLGGYAERMLLSAPLLLEVPNGLDPWHAALTEPMAVGLHAVNKSNIGPGDGALVLGCGPVGLAVIAGLKLKGVECIVAADFSPARRGLAAQMGATEVVDPAVEPAFDAWYRAGQGAPVVFEAIGVPGIIDGALRDAPSGARIVVVGVCMEPDAITPFFGISKELNIQFCLAYDPTEFADTLRSIAEGEIDVAPLVTGEVGLDGVAGAFDELADPERHCKILVRP